MTPNMTFSWSSLSEKLDGVSADSGKQLRPGNRGRRDFTSGVGVPCLLLLVVVSVVDAEVGVGRFGGGIMESSSANTQPADQTSTARV